MSDQAVKDLKKRILVVDDSPTALTIITELLNELGYTVESHAQAEDALASYKLRPFDAVVTDLRLGGMSGLELLKELKEHDKASIIILLTEHKEIDVEAELKEYESVYYFWKPTNVFELGAVLKNAFESRVFRKEIDSLRSLAVSLKSIGGVKDIEEEFKIVLTLAIDSLDADFGALVLRDVVAGDFELRVALDRQGKPSDGQADVITACAVEVANGQAARLHLLSDGPNALPVREGVQSVLAVPLIVERKLTGVLILERSRPYPAYTEKDLIIAKIFGTTVALAMENYKLFAEAKKSYGGMLEAQKGLIQLEKLASLGQLTAGIAHEIKNPLTVVTGLLGLVKRRLSDDRLIRDVDMCLRNCQRINQIITNLRTFYGPSRDGHFGPVNVHVVLEEALSLGSLRSDFRSVHLEKDFYEKALMVHGDESQILQVFVNLVNNAVQAMSNGGDLSVGTDVDGGKAKVYIRDNGKGIADENVAKVFDPFFTTKSSGKGTGLGLSISNTIIRNHGGSIEVTSEMGEGTMFTVTLPILIGSRQAATTEKVTEEEPSVLVVDDNEDILYFVRNLLEDHAFRVTTASSASQALEALAKASFDLVLLDSKMPGGDGITLYRETISKKYPDLRVALFTGSEDIHDESLNKLGFFVLLEKPCDGEKLIEVVRRAVR